MYDTKKKLSFLETLSLVGVLARLPFHLIFVAAFSPFLAKTKRKSLKRAISEAFPGYLIANLSVPQIQRLLGPSTNTYLAWAKKNSVKPVVEDVGSGGAKLLWLTEKKTDRVFLYVHGGGYMTTTTDGMIGFGPGLRKELLKQTGGKEDFSVAFLVYTLHPAKFPTQLAELVTALTQVISSGVSPENIILVGDSAGGNLLVQFIQHTFRPVPGIPLSPFSEIADVDVPRKLLGGMWLVSPWTSLGSPTPSYARNDKYDWVSAASFNYWGSQYVDGVSESQLSYINPSSATSLKGIEKITSRVLITAGSHECLLDDSLAIHSMIEELKIPRSKLEVTLDIEEGGVHEDVILDIDTPQKAGGRLSDATLRDLEWVRKTFGASSR